MQKFRLLGAFASNILPTVNTLGNAVIVVDANSGNDSSGKRGIWTKPFKTISAALLVAQDQDTIFIQPGVYTENLTMPGTFDNIRIRIVGIERNSVVIRGTVTVGTYRYWHGAASNDATNLALVIENVTIDTVSGTTPPVSIAVGNAVKFRNCSITSNNSVIVDIVGWDKPVLFESCFLFRKTGILLFNKTTSIAASVTFRNSHLRNNAAGVHSVVSGGNSGGRVTHFINCTSDSAFPAPSAELIIVNSVQITGSAYNLGWF
jgi:hypothetical protein